jgi:hypothetical protein
MVCAPLSVSTRKQIKSVLWSVFPTVGFNGILARQGVLNRFK